MLQKSFCMKRQLQHYWDQFSRVKRKKSRKLQALSHWTKAMKSFFLKSLRHLQFVSIYMIAHLNIYSTNHVLKWKKAFAESHIAGTVLIGLSKDFDCNLRDKKQKEKVNNLLSAFSYIAFGSASNILSPILLTRNV